MARQTKTTKTQAKATQAAASENADAEGGVSDDDDLGVAFEISITSWPNNAAGEHAREELGEPFSVQGKRYGAEMTVFATVGETTYHSDDLDGGRKQNIDAAIRSMLAKVPGIEAEKLKGWVREGEVPSSNEATPKPWDEGQPHAERLAEIAKDVNARLDNLSALDSRKREDWIIIGDEVDEAYQYVAGQSETTRAASGKAKANNAAWGEYVATNFPALTSMYRNIVNEVRNLGAAPDEVVKHWPESQNSPKAFQKWETNVRAALAAVFHTVLVVDSGKDEALRDWQDNGRPEDSKPPAVSISDIQEAYRNGEITDAVSKVRDRRIADAEKVRNKRDASVKERRDAAESENVAKAMLPVLDWRMAPLMAISDAAEFNKEKFGKQILDALESYHIDRDSEDTAEEREQSERVKSAKAEGKRMAALSVEQAVELMFNMLVAHPSADEVLDGLIDRMENRETVDEDAADKAADDADAGLDPNAQAAE